MVAGGSRLYRSAFGIGLTEGRLMYVLGYESVLTAQRASEIMGIDKGATSRALAGLQRRGLVRLTVDDADTRQRMIRFTRSGQALYDRLIATSLERERRLLAIFNEEEARTLAALLKRLHAHVSSPRTSKPAGDLLVFADPNRLVGVPEKRVPNELPISHGYAKALFQDRRLARLRLRRASAGRSAASAASATIIISLKSSA